MEQGKECLLFDQYLWIYVIMTILSLFFRYIMARYVGIFKINNNMQASQENTQNKGELDSTFINQAYSRTIHNEPQQPQQESTSTLNQIQKKIKDVEGRLIQIQDEKLSMNLTQEEYYHLQDQRAQLKKYLLDLDYEHKQGCFKMRKDAEDEARKKWENIYKRMEEQQRQIEKKREQERLERDRLLQEKLNEIEQASIQRRQEIQQLYNKSPIKIKQESNSSQHQENEYTKDEEIEKNILFRNRVGQEGKTQADKQAELRYRSKISAIQDELGSQSLRRSRQIELQGELIRLNTLSTHYREPYYSLYYPPLTYSPYDPLYPSLYSTYPYI